MPLSNPKAANHLAQARLNYRLYRELVARQEYWDWAVTLLFYTAVQLVQAWFVESLASPWDIPRNHGARETRVVRHFPAICKDYDYLTTRSRWARYGQDDRPGFPSERSEVDGCHNRLLRIAAELKGHGIDLADEQGPGAQQSGARDG